MDVSKRIYTIVELIKYRKLADIATDHCYIPILAKQLGKVDSAIAVDINPEPLARGAHNVKKAGYEDSIEFRLGNGFEPIAPYEAETAVIAGVGGTLACNILQCSLSIVQSFRQILISPQSDIDLVRKKVHQIGFCIANEVMVKDFGKYYTIIECAKGEDVAYNCWDYLIGKKLMENRSLLFLEYVDNEINKNKLIAEKLEKSSNSDDNIEKKERIIKTLECFESIRGEKNEML